MFDFTCNIDNVGKLGECFLASKIENIVLNRNNYVFFTFQTYV